jgi:hypothetical protein
MRGKESILLNRRVGGWGPKSQQLLMRKQQEFQDELMALDFHLKEQFDSGRKSP